MVLPDFVAVCSVAMSVAFTFHTIRPKCRGGVGKWGRGVAGWEAGVGRQQRPFVFILPQCSNFVNFMYLFL